MQWLIIFLGGGLGSCLRYLLALSMPKENYWLPLGTIMANLLACIVLGAVTTYYLQKPGAQKSVFWLVGFCGGFSTFSTFSQETLVYLQKGLYLQAGSNIVISVVICLLGLLLGAKIILANG